MSNIVFDTPNFTGTPDDEDNMTAEWIVDTENARRAALDPPGTPLAKTPAATLKASTLEVLRDNNLTGAWANYVKQAAESVNQDFTNAQVEEIRANLKRRIQAGEDPATIVADTAS